MCRDVRAVAFTLSLIFGCTSTADAPDTPARDGGGSGPDAGTADPSARAPSLKRKDGLQLTRDLAQALELDVDAVCQEFSRYDCATEAHRIVLGGVEAENLRIDDPLPGIGVSAPIAVDRVALSACLSRVNLDFGGTPVVFGPLVAGAPEGRSQVVDALYERLLGRAPDPEERRLLAEWSAPSEDRDFATLACFVVATTLEHLYY